MFISNRARLVRQSDSIERLIVDNRPIAAYDMDAKCAYKLGPCDDIEGVNVYLFRFLAKYLRHAQLKALVTNWDSVIIGSPIPRV